MSWKSAQEDAELLPKAIAAKDKEITSTRDVHIHAQVYRQPLQITVTTVQKYGGRYGQEEGWPRPPYPRGY